ncbi:MAG: riboflavin synthase [Armatimonadota bacterium]
MFTGLIEETGVLRKITPGTVYKLEIESDIVSKDAKIGDSISVNGVCLTVTSISGKYLTFDAVQETINRSSLGNLKPSSKVNLESSLRAGGKIGGHFVLGHVDAVGVVENIEILADSYVYTFSCEPNAMRYIVEKGSVAVEGISLTVAKCMMDRFQVAVIPHTAQVTTLRDKKPGDIVNIETDILGRYIEKFTQPEKSDITEEFLKQAGFM